MSSLCVYQDLECGEHVLFDNVQYCVYLENGKKCLNKWHHIKHDTTLLANIGWEVHGTSS